MDLRWYSVVPFALMLAIVAIAPLTPRVREYWSRPQIQLVISLCLGLPVLLWFAARCENEKIIANIIEYGQFITLLLTLYVISGGVYLRGNLIASPRNNTILLAVGAVLASFIGTTGAAMLLIRPLLRTNYERMHRVHIPVFAIFLIANSGGLLTPLGDPPLFLGLLRGVPFFWTLQLFPQWLFVNSLLLFVFYAVDSQRYSQESATARALDRALRDPLRVSGSVHFIYLLAVVVAIIYLPSIDISSGGPPGERVWTHFIPWREAVMGLMILISLRSGSREVRYRDNGFQWAPIGEVAAIFVGIFLTMAPALEYLAVLAPNFPIDEISMFAFSGGLSSILDNAPTYATFFEIAKTVPVSDAVAGVPETLLVAISLGSVFGGAMTYIGNGPNFMIKAIAERRAINMPSFGGYFLMAIKYVLPILFAMTLIFISKSDITIIGGTVVSGLIVAWCIVVVVKAQRHRLNTAQRCV